MKKKNTVNIYDVAKAAGVSISTVSRALNNDSRISEATAIKVKEVARELGFRKNYLASGLSTNRTRVIGVMVPQLNREFLASTVNSIEETAFGFGYSVIICQTNNSYERERAYIDTLMSTRVAGIIVTLALETEDYGHFFKAMEAGIPVVFFDRVSLDIRRATKIIIDDYQVAKEATRHLIGQGYRQIAYVSGPVKQLLYQRRLEGFRDALLEAGLSPEHSPVEYARQLSYEEGLEAARRLLSHSPMPDAIFTSNALMAISTLFHAQDLGISIPGQLGVLGFSEEPVSAFMRPSVSSIRQPSSAMGRLAVEKLLEEINAPDPDAFVYQQITLETQLVVRDSTRRSG